MRGMANWWSAFVLGALLVVPAGAAVEAAPARIVHYNCTCHGEYWTEWLNAQADAYMKRHPGVKIEVITEPGDYYDKLLVLAAAGDFPDVTEVIPAQSIPYLERNLWVDLTPIIARDPDFRLREFIPVTLDLFRWGQGLYGLPASAFSLIGSYNAEHFLAAGADLPNNMGDGWNWPGWIQVSRKLVRDLNGDGAPDELATALSTSIWRLSYWAENAGGSMFDQRIDPQRSRFASPPVVTAAEFMKSWIDLGVADRDFSSSRDRLLAGKIGMIFDQGSTIISYYQNAGTLFSLDFVELPRGPRKGGTDVTANGFQISAATPHLEEVWKWVKHLTANVEVVRDHVRRTTRVPALYRLIPEYGKLVGSDAPHVAAWVQSVANPESQMRPLIREGVQIDRLFSAAMRRVLQGEVPASEAFRDLDQRVNAILQEAHARR